MSDNNNYTNLIPSNLPIKQVSMARNNDVLFRDHVVAQALYDTGASHNCISEKLLEKLKLDVSNSPISNVDIKLGDKSVISKSCVVVELLVKLNKLFVDLNSDSPSFSVKIKDKFYVHDAGYDVVLSYPLLMEAEKQSLTVQLMTENQETKESPEEEKEEIIDLESMINSFTDFSVIPVFEIDENFPLREQYEKLLEKFNDLFTSPFSDQHLDVKPFKIDLVEGAQLRRAYPRSLTPVIQKKVDEEIARLVELGIVRKSNSFMCSPIVVAKKPDGSIRLCVDFRELNL